MGGGEYTEGTRHAFWTGFVVTVAGTLYVLRSSYHGRFKKTRIYHYITALIMLVSALAYLVMALGSMPGSPLGLEDVNVIQFCDWIVGTPLLLIDLGMLARLDIPELFFICFLDIIMIVSGFVSYEADTPVGIWPLFVFSCIMQIAVLGTLVTHLYASRTSPDVHPVENRVYRFLSVLTIVIWTVFPIKFAVFEAGAMSLEADVIIGCFCDICAKVIFGLILVGSREAMEGEQTPIALVSMAIVGLTAKEINLYIEEFGEEHNEVKKPRRRCSDAGSANNDVISATHVSLSSGSAPAPASSTARSETVSDATASASSSGIIKKDLSVRVLPSGSMPVSGAGVNAGQPDVIIRTVVSTNGSTQPMQTRTRTNSSTVHRNSLARSSPTIDANEQTQQRSVASPIESYSQSKSFVALATEKHSLELQAEQIRLAQAQIALEVQALELDMAMRKGATHSFEGVNKYHESLSIGSMNESEDAILRLQRGPGQWPMLGYRESASRHSHASTASPKRGSSSVSRQISNASSNAGISNLKFSPSSPHSLSRAPFPAMTHNYQSAASDTEVLGGPGAVGLEATEDVGGGVGGTGMSPAQGGPFTSVAI